jgi:DNA-binding NarL/FixJ family response regulator
VWTIAHDVKEPVRVLLLAMPQLLRGILEHAIQLQSDFELLKDTRRTLQMLTEQMVPPDVVILGLSAAEDATLVPALFARWPTAKVLTVTQAGDDAAVYELKPRRRALGQMSPAEIVESLRDAVHPSREPLQE